MDDDAGLEYRLLQAAREGQTQAARNFGLDKQILVYREITVYAPQAQPREIVLSARIAFDGTVLTLSKGFKAADPSGVLGEGEAVERARKLLAERGSTSRATDLRR